MSETTVIQLPTPHAKQREVLAIVDNIQPGQREIVLYGGSANVGKSWTICLAALRISFKYPGANILVARDEFASLRDTTMAAFKAITNDIPQKGDDEHDQIVSWNSNTNTCQISLDSDEPPATIFWRQAHDGAAHLSTEYAAIFLDEADRIPRASVSILVGRLRQKPAGVTPGWLMMIASNPYPGWFEEWWKKYDALGEKLKELGVGRMHRVAARIEDNPYADGGYKGFMSVLMTEADYKRFGEGSFDFFEGQVFKGFTSGRNIMPQRWLQENREKFPTQEVAYRGQSFLVPKFGHVSGGLDFGGANPDAHLSAATVTLTFNSAGAWRDVVAFEFGDRGQNVALRQRQWMLEMEHVFRRKIQWVADKTQALGIQLLQNQGFSIVTNEGKADSWERTIEYMRDRMAPDNHGVASFFVMDTCPGLIEEIRKYRVDTRPLPNGAYRLRPIKVDDDRLDTVRYDQERKQRSGMLPLPDRSPVGYAWDTRTQTRTANPFKGGQYAWQKQGVA